MRCPARTSGWRPTVPALRHGSAHRGCHPIVAPALARTPALAADRVSSAAADHPHWNATCARSPDTTGKTGLETNGTGAPPALTGQAARRIPPCKPVVVYRPGAGGSGIGEATVRKPMRPPAGPNAPRSSRPRRTARAQQAPKPMQVAVGSIARGAPPHRTKSPPSHGRRRCPDDRHGATGSSTSPPPPPAAPRRTPAAAAAAKTGAPAPRPTTR